jgi:hypothetical protein
MSSTNKPTRRIMTRGKARDKIAKVMKHVHSGSIAEGNPDQPEDDKTSTTKKEDNAEAMKPSGRKKATATKAANAAKKPQTTKKANGKAVKETDMAAKKALAAKLVQLEDGFLKKADISCCRNSLLYIGSEDNNELGLEVTGWAWNKRMSTKTMMMETRARVRSSMVAVRLGL